jgi:hypothetical protein
MTTSAENVGWWSEEMLDDDPAQTKFARWGDAGHDPVAEPAEVVDPPEGSRPARLVLGMAVLAAEQLGPRPANDGAFATGVGLVAQTAAEARQLAQRAMRPPKRFARWTNTLPGANMRRRYASRYRDAIDRVVSEARKRGGSAMTAGRADASAFVQARVNDGMAWAQNRAVPQIVDGLVPHLVDKVVPRIIDGALPQIREKVMPVIIEDLTNDPQVRELVVEQGRGVVGEAAQQLRTTTATADDRVESAFRRLVRNPAVAEEPALADEPAPQERPPLGNG